MSIPGITKTWSAKNRDSVRPAMIGPPRSTWTSVDPMTGARAAIDAPIPSPPVSVLVPPEDLPGEGHAERAQEEEDSGDPRQLARVLVGAKEEDLQHVQRHHKHHPIGAPEMDGAEIRAERRLIVQVLKALVRLVGGGDVHERQADAGGDLEREERERRAPEDVPPARGSPRNRTGHRGSERFGAPR